MNKYEEYQELKNILEKKYIKVGVYEEINFGIQFPITDGANQAKVRVYESKKKGITVDLSQVEHEALKALFYEGEVAIGRYATKTEYATDDLDQALIGVDESGKGDYFGPLVVAGVYADKETKLKLISMGVTDSKALSDAQIAVLAKKIKEITTHSVLVIKNEKYNQLYSKINNLNKLLAWGHARVIENLLEKVECKYALCDQFGNESLIQNALMDKGRNIILEQRTKGVQNIVVAAASILARDEFVHQIECLKSKYGIDFPKGASGPIVRYAKEYAGQYGKERLDEVAKLHFKTTEKV